MVHGWQQLPWKTRQASVALQWARGSKSIITSKRRTMDLLHSYLHPSQQPANGTFLLLCTSTQASWLFIENTDHGRMLSPPGPRSTTLDTEKTKRYLQLQIWSPGPDPLCCDSIAGFQNKLYVCLMHSRAMGFAEWQDTYVRVTCTAAWTYQGIFICWALIKDLPSPIPPTR